MCLLPLVILISVLLLYNQLTRSMGALLSAVRPSNESLNMRMILGIPEHIYCNLYIWNRKSSLSFLFKNIFNGKHKILSCYYSSVNFLTGWMKESTHSLI